MLPPAVTVMLPMVGASVGNKSRAVTDPTCTSKAAATLMEPSKVVIEFSWTSPDSSISIAPEPVADSTSWLALISKAFEAPIPVTELIVVTAPSSLAVMSVPVSPPSVTAPAVSIETADAVAFVVDKELS